MPEVTLDFAVELLEITDISDVQVDDLRSIRKRAFARWHPDKVAHTNNPELTKEYQENTQLIDQCVALIEDFLKGNYKAGEKYNYQDTKQTDPIERLRKNAEELQQRIREVWEQVKATNYKLEIVDELIADGYKLGDLLHKDLKEDVQRLSLVSMFDFAFISIIPCALLANFGLGFVYGIFWLLQIVSCILIFLPLSRFWLGKTAPFFTWFVDVGLKVGYHAIEFVGHILFFQIVFWIPRIFARLMYFIMYPLYFLAIAIVGEMVVGQVKRKNKFYAGVADWYIEDLLNKKTEELKEDELYHLAHLYNELLEVKTIK